MSSPYTIVNLNPDGTPNVNVPSGAQVQNEQPQNLNDLALNNLPTLHRGGSLNFPDLTNWANAVGGNVITGQGIFQQVMAYVQANPGVSFVAAVLVIMLAADAHTKGSSRR